MENINLELKLVCDKKDLQSNLNRLFDVGCLSV